MMAAEHTRLYMEYRDRVLAYIRARVRQQEDAEDLCEEVFEKAFRVSDRYDARKAAPGTWLYVITRNTVIDYFRRVRPTEELPEDLSDGKLTEDGVIQSELLDALAAALENLPGELADIIVLRYYDSLPLTEVAARLGMSYGAVKLRHQKAILMLRTLLV